MKYLQPLPFRWIAAAVALCALAVSGAHAQNTPAPRLITSQVVSSDRVTLKGEVSPQLRVAEDLGPVSGDTSLPSMQFVLARSEVRAQQLRQYLVGVQQPGSPLFHQWLTPAQYGAMFGASTDDIQTLTAWLQSQGFTVHPPVAAGNILRFSGTAAQVESAFGTQIHTVLIAGVRHHANLTAPQLPRSLAPAVLALAGLNDFHPHADIQKGTGGRFNPEKRSIEPDFTLFNSSGPVLFVDPADADTIYDVPNATLNPNYSGTTYDGSGVTVGVVGDSDVDLTPVSLYREDFLGETAATVNLPSIIIDGSDPGINGDETESFLDLEVLGGIAPKATIHYYASEDTDISPGIINAVERAINDNTVSVLSMSFGACEAEVGQAFEDVIEEEYQQAAAQGITITVSAGDSGSANCDSDGDTTATQGFAVNGLASTPYNIAVGGTDYDVLSANFTQYVSDSNSGAPPYWLTALSYIPEEPWNDSTSSNGALANNTRS